LSEAQLRGLPGWVMLDEASQLMLLTVGSAVRLFSAVASSGVPHYSFAEFLATVKEARAQLAERLVEAEARQAIAEHEMETDHGGPTVHGGSGSNSNLNSRLPPLCSSADEEGLASRAVWHARVGILNSRQRLDAIDKFTMQARLAARSEHAWQLERSFAMMGQRL
jgi:hypothetical protein